MDRSDSRSLFDSSLSRSPSTLVGEKRRNSDSGSGLEPPCRRIKMQGLDAALSTEESSELEEARVQEKMGIKGEICLTSDRLQEGTTSQGSLSFLESGGHIDSSQSLASHSICDKTTSGCVTGENCRITIPKKLEKDIDLNISTSSGFGMDLNVDYPANVVNEDPFYPYKRSDNVKSTQSSECGSSTGPLEESEPMRKWKAMKQNGFLSSSHGGIPIPKQRGSSRKNKSDAFNKKIELAKKDQVNRFAKMAAPSGLLTGLNPGIINHVRNGKQVKSIIEALVRSEKLNGQIQNRPVNQMQMRMRNKEEASNGNSCLENMHDPEINHSSKMLPLSRQTIGDPTLLSRLSIPSSMEHNNNGLESDALERSISYQPSSASHSTSDCEDNTIALKLSSAVTVALENASSVSSEELSENQECVNSLSVKAATVASRWLDLLQQDIRGRLAALRRSKKRIRCMIQRELPSLVSKQFLTNNENDPNPSQSSSSGCSSNASPDIHMSRWRSLFSQMDKALSEEGKHLETWLGQVKEMQLHCEQGLQYVNLMGIDQLQQPGSSDRSRSKKAEAAVTAAAASIYSTCNFVMTAENVSCF